MKIIAMIPARLGSKRVKNKNLRLLGNKPLISHVIETVKDSGVFDDIYINSESEVFEKIANQYGIKFYKRPGELSSDTATNDDFTLDFMKNVEGDLLIQVLSTSPFITKEQVISFVKKAKTVDTLISTKEVKIESIYKNKPINFNQKAQTPPSQLLEPVNAYACSLMSWGYKNFIKNIEKYNAGYHGGDGTIEFFKLDGYATVDIDEEQDFQLAESIINSETKEPEYYNENKIYDHNVERVLTQDGVSFNDLYNFNSPVTKVKEIIDKNRDDVSWSYTVINSKSNRATLIAQMPGEGNRLHYHSDWDEWWYILKGEWEWFVEGDTLTVREGDIVFIERNKKHKITAIGDKQAIRLAVSRDDVDHIYE
jgi:CMP-N-acetylneuraminic acid synthetase/quercetin dioxygenase-like cupin family protein